MSQSSLLTIRDATIHDTELLLELITELARYEKAEHEVLATVATLQQTLFSDNTKAYSVIAELDQQPVGFALYFYNYSTWLAQNGMYLEDLYVQPEHRKKGIGKALLKHLATIAVNNQCGRFEWSVLDWNTPAIEFYQSVGAKPQSEWTVYRLTGQALYNFAASP